MENVMIAFGVVGMISLLVLLVRGVPTASLANAKPGQVYTFCYLQPKDGTCVRRRVKILENNRLSQSAIDRLNDRSSYRRLDPIFERTGTLVTGESNDGVRNYYAERAKDVRRQLV